MTGTLLSLGHGYSAQALARRLLPQGWRIIGTTRSPEKAEQLRAKGVEPLLWPCDLSAALAESTHLLSSIAPDEAGDPVLASHRAGIAAAPLAWVGYLSTTGVYGDHQGGWVDETDDLDFGVSDRRKANEERRQQRRRERDASASAAPAKGPAVGRSRLGATRGGWE